VADWTCSKRASQDGKGKLQHESELLLLPNNQTSSAIDLHQNLTILIFVVIISARHLWLIGDKTPNIELI